MRLIIKDKDLLGLLLRKASQYPHLNKTSKNSAPIFFLSDSFPYSITEGEGRLGLPIKGSGSFTQT